MQSVRSIDPSVQPVGTVLPAAGKQSTVSVKDNLLLMATDRFCGIDDHDRLTIDQYREAFRSLVMTAHHSTLEAVSEKLSQNPFTPRDVVLYLANEPIAIAKPMLMSSPVLTQLDLVRAVENGSIDFSRAIAQRPDLGPSLVLRLKKFADLQINDILASNHALTNRMKRGDAESLFKHILTGESVIEEPVSQLNTEYQPKFTVSITRSKNNKPSAKTTPIAANTAESKLLEAAGRGGRLPEPNLEPTEQTAAETSQSNQPSRHTVEEFAYAMEKMALCRSNQGMAVLMQKRFNLTLETCHQVLDDHSGDTMSVLLKAAEIDAPTANRITLLTFPTIGLSIQNTKRAIGFYANLESAACLEAVEQWPSQDSVVQPAGKPATHQSYLAETPKDVREAQRKPASIQDRSWAEVAARFRQSA